MKTSVLLMLMATFIGSLVGTWLMRRIALTHDIIDRPNSRSSHLQPTPRGGGVALVGTSTLAFIGLYFLDFRSNPLLLALLLGGLPIAVVGFFDDRSSVAAGVRFAVHALAALAGVLILGGLPPLAGNGAVIDLGIWGDALTVVAIVWATNLYNFMDGIDGIAASESIFVLGVGALLTASMGSFVDPVVMSALVLATAACGFLIWNWPPAKIFMGDVGSGYLGYVIAILALAAAHERPAMLFAWLVLGGVFFVDATVTLIRRLLRRERVYQAHRTHAYQRLARRWQSHRRVTLAVWAVNLFWLLPMAWLCTRFSSNAFWIAGLALGPLVAVALFAGAGKAESSE